MADLPLSGVELVVKNAQTAIKDLKAYQAALGQQNKMVTQAAVTGNNTSKVLGALSKDFSSIGKNILSNLPGVGKFSNLLGALGTSGATAASGTAAAAAGTTALAGSMSLALPIIGATAVALGGIFLLGSRGARLQPTIDAFGNLASQFGDSTEILNRLREQTKGTVSDMELMRIATFALSGASQELGQIFAQDLGKNLNDVGRLAVAMGRDPVEAQTRWIDALKKGERELLDELGIIVSATEANRKYAESVGKSAESLSAYEKTAAFAKEASLQLNEAVAKLPEQSSVLVTLQRIPVVFKNILDKLSLAIQPVFEPLLATINDVITAIDNLASFAIPVLATVFEVVGAVIQEVRDTVNAALDEIFGGFSDGVTNVLPYVVAAFQIAGQGMIEVIHTLGDAMRSFVSFMLIPLKALGGLFGKAFKGVNENISGNLTQLAFNLGKGGAQIIGSFAAGIINGGKFVLEAVTAIAQIVADFLVGFSPPKKGPLANIDKGGENVAISWVGGFMEGVQSSFGAVTAYVNERLGAIARLSREQIEVRLKMLDLALRPFKENLAIVKADMEAIAGFTDPALRIMERQRKSLLKAFGEGKIGDIEQLRNLDRQIQRMKELKDFGQDQVDQAELKLALAQSQQAQERALLNIAKDRLGEAEKATGVGKEAAEKAAKGGGAGAGAGDTGGGAGLPIGGGAPDLLSSDAIDKARGEIIGAIGSVVDAGTQGAMQGLADSGFSEALAGFKGQSLEMGKQMKRIQDANPAQKIADKFAGLKDSLAETFDGIKESLTTKFNEMFGEDSTIMMSINNFKTILTNIFSGALNPFALANIAISGLIANAQAQFPLLLEAVNSALTPIRETMTALFTGDESPFTLATTAVTTAIDTMKTKFGELAEEIRLKLNDVQLFISSHFIDPSGIIEKAKTAVSDMMNFVIEQFFRLTNTGANTLSNAVSTLAAVIRRTILEPVAGGMSAVANTVIDAMNALIREFNSLPLGIDVPELTRITISLEALGYKRGTLLGENRPFMAGEGGKPELVVPSRNNPLSVFPGKATAALTSIAGMMNKPAPQPQYIPVPRYDRSGGGDSIKDSYNSNKQLTINARQKMSRLEMLQLLSRM